MRIAIASGKGGTGKTTVAVNVAVRLARQLPVVLVDLDVEEPNAGLFLGGGLQHQEEVFKQIPTWQAERCRGCGLCQEVCNFNAVLALPESITILPELCHSCYACSELCPTQALPMMPRAIGVLRDVREGSLSHVEGRLEIGEEQAVPLIKHTLGYVERTYPDVPFVVVDAPAGTSCPVIEATRDADLVLLVTEPTPFGLHDLRLAVDTMRSLGRPVRVVLNRHGLGDDRVEEYCAEERIELLALIPNRREAAERCASGQLLDSSLPDVSRALDDLTDRLLELATGAPR
jgi:MinD superfamily P-loop ATPase